MAVIALPYETRAELVAVRPPTSRRTQGGPAIRRPTSKSELPATTLPADFRNVRLESLIARSVLVPRSESCETKTKPATQPNSPRLARARAVPVLRHERQTEVRALDVPNEALGFRRPALDAAHPRDSLLQLVEPVRRLAGVRVARGPLAFLDAGDVDVVRRRERHRARAVRDLVVVERETALHPQPRLVHEHRHRAMVRMVVDRPVREDDMRAFRVEQRVERAITLLIDDGLAVDLS